MFPILLALHTILHEDPKYALEAYLKIEVLKEPFFRSFQNLLGQRL